MSHDLTSRWQASMMDNYGTPPLTLARGDGAEVWDADGNRFLDLVGGIAVNALGHAHPAIVEAVGAQLRRLGHVSNLFSHEPGVELAETLLRLAGAPDGRVFFCNSGAEANETAFKIARRTGRRGVVAADGGFHGRTMGALALTGQPAKRAPFEPLVPGVTHVSYGDVAALEAAVTSDTAAVILEPVLGEGGVVPAPDGYLRAAREITNAHRSLLILDEVQTGIGRTGSWFAFQQAGITPDVITLAKGLGGGLPIGACLGVGDAGRLLQPGDHGATFGGNPVSAAAALAVLRIVADDDLADNAATVGKEIAAGLTGLPGVDHVRGLGLLLGVVLDGPTAGSIATAAREHGFLVNPVQPDVIRLAPALVLTSEQADEFVSAWPGIAAAARA